MKERYVRNFVKCRGSLVMLMDATGDNMDDVPGADGALAIVLPNKPQERGEANCEVSFDWRFPCHHHLAPARRTSATNLP